ncbi:hypothetical protein WA026_011666 [Henosepilachna vigintioctopunctata]|uniref:Arrestin C-terminal-like domain-containing protein n=1 Tax=Henosepilachna vigintioctopunctata TaxID=420089 RepID=A0AAW1TSW9_9CUCU
MKHNSLPNLQESSCIYKRGCSSNIFKSFKIDYCLMNNDEVFQKITIHFTHPRPHEMSYWEYVTKGTKFPGVGKHEEVAYPLYVEVPKNLHVPHIKYSNLFKISYQLQIIAKLSGFNTAMVLQLKIYIGHIPFDTSLKRWRTSFFDDKDDDVVSNFSTT